MAWAAYTKGYPRREWRATAKNFHKLVMQESVIEFDYELLGYVELLPGGWTAVRYHPGPLMSKEIGRYDTKEEAKAVLIAVVALEE